MVTNLHPLEPSGFVGDIHKWLTCNKSSDIFQERLKMPFGDVDGCGSDVGGDDDVFHFPERMIGREWLGFENVEARAGKFTIEKSCH